MRMAGRRFRGRIERRDAEARKAWCPGGENIISAD